MQRMLHSAILLADSGSRRVPGPVMMCLAHGSRPYSAPVRKVFL